MPLSSVHHHPIRLQGSCHFQGLSGPGFFPSSSSGQDTFCLLVLSSDSPSSGQAGTRPSGQNRLVSSGLSGSASGRQVRSGHQGQGCPGWTGSFFQVIVRSEHRQSSSGSGGSNQPVGSPGSGQVNTGQHHQATGSVRQVRLRSGRQADRLQGFGLNFVSV